MMDPDLQERLLRERLENLKTGRPSSGGTNPQDEDSQLRARLDRLRVRDTRAQDATNIEARVKALRQQQAIEVPEMYNRFQKLSGRNAVAASVDSPEINDLLDSCEAGDMNEVDRFLQEFEAERPAQPPDSHDLAYPDTQPKRLQEDASEVDALMNQFIGNTGNDTSDVDNLGAICGEDDEISLIMKQAREAALLEDRMKAAGIVLPDPEKEEKNQDENPSQSHRKNDKAKQRRERRKRRDSFDSTYSDSSDSLTDSDSDSDCSAD